MQHHGLGGFSAYDDSFAAFKSAEIEAVAVVFMVVAGVNFALYFLAWKRRSLWAIWRDTEARAYFALMAGAVLLVAFY